MFLFMCDREVQGYSVHTIVSPYASPSLQYEEQIRHKFYLSSILFLYTVHIALFPSPPQIPVYLTLCGGILYIPFSYLNNELQCPIWGGESEIRGKTIELTGKIFRTLNER